MARLARFVVVASSLLAAAVFGQTNGGRGVKPYTTWTAYGGGAHSSQYSALDQINRSNVSRLEVAWTIPATGTVIFNPLIAGEVMFVQVSPTTLAAVDAALGKEIWRQETKGTIGARGMNYWESPDRSDRRLLLIAGGYLTAIDAQRGDPIASFGDDGRVDLRIALHREAAQPLSTGNPGRVFENTIIVSLPAQGAGYDATPADVQAYDVRTGRIQWVFHSIPHPGEFGYDTWPPEGYKKSGGVHNWSEFTVDERRAIAFIGFGSPRFDFYGGDRPGANLFGNSLVALDARTGKRIWHYQLVHHDLWDYDLPQAPKLLTIRRNGRTIDVVAQATKQGFLFVFERDTGRPIWPIEERPVPPSDVPGEHASATQPFATRPAPFARQTFTEKDINPYLRAADREALVQRLKALRNDGLFTPPGFEGSISMPGHNGGANFATSAVDPDRGEMYIVAKALPTVDRLTLPGEGGRGGRAGPIVTPEQKRAMIARAQELLAEGGPPRLNSPYEFMNQNSLGMSAAGPPWSEMTAYDLNTGAIKWRIPTGTVVAPAELSIPPNTGSHFPRGAPLVTAGGLIFFATGSDRRFRAYDRDDGREVWSMELPSASEGMPATYAIDGRQFIVVPVAAGSGLFAPRF
ncbi:MAG TPA: PQQ-binding-like beta-propeller repeat protein, partial [Vicinamibacterales bacterium]|nr:PQQ-binding-like beta-propeller repeat protein [Vicinamibacterales bacterium]